MTGGGDLVTAAPGTINC